MVNCGYGYNFFHIIFPKICHRAHITPFPHCDSVFCYVSSNQAQSTSVLISDINARLFNPGLEPNLNPIILLPGLLRSPKWGPGSCRPCSATPSARRTATATSAPSDRPQTPRRRSGVFAFRLRPSKRLWCERMTFRSLRHPRQVHIDLKIVFKSIC